MDEDNIINELIAENDQATIKDFIELMKELNSIALTKKEMK